jgi:hypothetical protein
MGINNRKKSQAVACLPTCFLKKVGAEQDSDGDGRKSTSGGLACLKDVTDKCPSASVDE